MSPSAPWVPARDPTVAMDFLELLRSTAAWPLLSAPSPAQQSLVMAPPLEVLSHGTTVVAFEYADGIVIAGDRRATAGGVVVYDRADKVIEIDSHTVLAIAGTPATAFEMARILRLSFQHYRRSQLQPLSLEARVRSVSKLIRENVGLTLQGVGIVVPLLAGCDPTRPGTPPRLYFYDALGAEFQAAEFAVSGSGSPGVRSILHYLNRWSGRPTRVRSEEEAVTLALQLLDVAAESDTATGGIDRRTGVYPLVKVMTVSGVSTVDPDRLRDLFGGGVLP